MSPRSPLPPLALAARAPLDEGELAALFTASWPAYVPRPFARCGFTPSSAGVRRLRPEDH